ncbi:hypothetical protein F4801DRAFT_19000 [Xylaria longipes]|nr:hypothetical protein F4801DRAFT_19000 [Xylaria longipes]
MLGLSLSLLFNTICTSIHMVCASALNGCTYCVIMSALCKISYGLTTQRHRDGFARDLYLPVGGTSLSLLLLFLSATPPGNSACPDLESSGGCAHAGPSRLNVPTRWILPTLSCFRVFAPDMPTRIPFCLLAKPTPLFLSSVDRVPCQLSPSETLHGCGGLAHGSGPHSTRWLSSACGWMARVVWR